MGVVVKCRHLQLDELVAIKMLRPDVVLDPDAVERFMREAQAAVKLKSEYVARVSDVGTLETGVPYMVMEFLEGHDLGALVDEQGCIQVGWACQLMLQTAEALSEAHSLNIVHRDIKPANLFVTWRPDRTSLIKVLDFGISKAQTGTDMHLTQTQSLLGTPAYMSPEQMRSAKMVDTRTDIWSLGSVLYELIEGRKPFEAESFSEMCVKVAVDPPQPMFNAPPELQQVILRCLAKSPEQRYPTMADVGRELIPFCQDPQQATVLVERMQRMLRHSREGGWETQTGTRSVPNYVRDPKSQPLHAQAWQGDAANRFSTPLPVQGAVPLHAPHERSAPARAHSEWGPTQKSPSKKGLVAVITLLALVGIGVGLALGLSGDDPAGDGRIVTPSTTTPSTSGIPSTAGTTPSTGTTSTTPSTGTPSTTGTTPTTSDTPSTAGTTPTPSTAGTTPTTNDTPSTGTTPATSDTPSTGTTHATSDTPSTGTTHAKTDGAPIGTAKTVAKPGGTKTTAKTGTKTTLKTGTKTTKETVKETVRETPVVKETPACDPFANPRGCGTKK
jgi:serine/threonine protein kinase